MAKKLCLFCPAMFEPYAPLAKRQRVCEDPECRRRLKRMLEAALLRRRSAAWRRYRKGHRAYVRRDNSRRVCSRRRGMSAKPE